MPMRCDRERKFSKFTSTAKVDDDSYPPAGSRCGCTQHIDIASPNYNNCDRTTANESLSEQKCTEAADGKPILKLCLQDRDVFGMEVCSVRHIDHANCIVYKYRVVTQLHRFEFRTFFLDHVSSSAICVHNYPCFTIFVHCIPFTLYSENE